MAELNLDRQAGLSLLLQGKAPGNPELHQQIENLARLHIQHGLYHSEGFRMQKERVRNTIRENNVNVRKELDPQINLLYRRYFE